MNARAVASSSSVAAVTGTPSRWSRGHPVRRERAPRCTRRRPGPPDGRRRARCRTGDGYWLRRFLSEEESQSGPFTYIDRAGTQPSINWYGVATQLIGNTVGGALSHTPTVGSRSDLAVLSIASSLAGGTPIELREVLAPLDGEELRLVLRALQAVYGEDTREH